MRVRAAVWPEGTRGTVFVFPGRTEYIEKYSDAARHLGAQGFACVAVDWRGQGLTERPKHSRHVGHVNDFSDFQHDVDVLLHHADAMDLPRPWYMLAHSMGGLIGLRTVQDRPEFASVAFSAPMWGLPIAPHMRVLAWGMSSVGSSVGFGERMTPASGKVANPATAPFDGNLLTNDPEMFAWMQAQITAHPDLALGGPSLGWLWAALREMHRLARRAAPDMPCLTIVGTNEAIVDVDAIHVRMASWAGSRIETVPGGRHETLMEDSATRGRLYDTIARHFGGSAV
ncbi:MAG: alpha/beta hydrolase [Jannaschia sp.]